MPERLFEIFSGRGVPQSDIVGTPLRGAFEWANTFLSQLEREAKLGIWEIDLATNDLRWSRETYAIHGLDPSEGIDRHRASECYDPDDLIGLRAAYKEAIERGTLRYQATIVLPDGSQRRVQHSAERVSIPDRGDVLLGFVRDITEAHESYCALQYAAHHDQLTGLLNRRGFDAALLARGTGSKAGRRFQILLLDLDYFKLINDTRGHFCGDTVLARIGAILREELPEGYTIARWGGDEFAILTPSPMDDETGTALASRLLAQIGRPLAIGSQAVQVAATCGISSSCFAIAPTETLRQADIALCKAKSRGRGGVLRYTPELEEELSARQHQLQMVKQAMHDRRLFPAYQPIVDLGSGAIVGVEALVRLYRPDGSVLAAADFFSALSDPETSWSVFETVLAGIVRDRFELQNALPELRYIAINATQADLFRPGFAEYFHREVTEGGFEPGFITLELTETTLHSGDREDILEVLRRLHDLGFKIALDDFGTGYSSLTHLRDLPIQKIKLDSSFTRRLLTERASRAIVMGTIAMSRALDIEVIGEGVEDIQTSELLTAFQCHCAQGHLFSPAVSADQLGRIASETKRRVA